MRVLSKTDLNNTEHVIFLILSDWMLVLIIRKHQYDQFENQMMFIYHENIFEWCLTERWL